MCAKIKVSIIIPIYSVAEFLPICIESVLNQTYSMKEIILVDDGSIDSSSEICDEYASLYNNIKVIHKENGGLSDARNKGIEIATGDYIMFLDGDDFWDDINALESLVERIMLTNADVLNFSFKKYYEDTEEKVPYFHNVPDMPLKFKKKKEQFEYLSKNHLYISSACTKMIRRTLFGNELLFEVGVYSEDVEWSAKLIKSVETMDFICLNFYCYRQRRDSISHTINDKKSRDLCGHIVKCIEMANYALDEEKILMYNYAAYQFGTYFIVQAQTVNCQVECIETLNRYAYILSNHKNSRKLTVLYFLTVLFGYKRICKWIRYVYKLKH